MLILGFIAYPNFCRSRRVHRIGEFLQKVDAPFVTRCHRDRQHLVTLTRGMWENIKNAFVSITPSRLRCIQLLRALRGQDHWLQARFLLDTVRRRISCTPR